MNELRTRFGRPLRLAIVGGGPGAWIGEMHRTAAELDGHWRVCRRRIFQRRRALAERRGRDGLRRRAQLRRRRRAARSREAAAGRHRRGRDHDAERHALSVRRGRARRRARRRRRQAGDARFRAGLRPGRAHAQERQDLRDRARLLRVSDDALRPAPGPRRRARRTASGPGRVHPERTGDAPRGRPVEQPARAGSSTRSAAVCRW